MMAEEQLLKTALHDTHLAAGATMGVEGGWAVPMSYRGALEEAAEVRNHAGVFDVSHVGRIRIRGDEGLELVEKLCTADVVHQEDDTARFTLLLNESGGVLADALIVRLDGWWLITTDPCNRLKVLEHARAAGEAMAVKVDDQTLQTAMVAVSGPAARDVLDAALPQRPGDLPRGSAKVGSLMIARYIAMRTSYTGLWGLEVMLPKMFAPRAWRFITQKAADNCLSAAGMGAREVLRIEAGLCRYARELNETIDPLTAGLGWAVDFEHDFVGRDALARIRGSGISRKRVGLVLTALDDRSGRRDIPGLGTPVCAVGGQEAGTVTSGTYSPALDARVAMAYVAVDAAGVGTELQVDMSGERIGAKVVELPFVQAAEK